MSLHTFSIRGLALRVSKRPMKNPEKYSLEIRQTYGCPGCLAMRGEDHAPDCSEVAVELCIDCDGLGKYPSGAECKSCGGSGRVGAGDGIPIPENLN